MGKKSKPPPAPDYTPLAEKTATSANEAATATTMQNRPNQVDIYGNTSTWTTDAEGRPVQTQTLGADSQGQLDRQNAMIGTAQDQAAAATGSPLDFSGATKVGNYDMGALQGVDANGLRAGAGQFNMDPMGNSKEIQDATYGLLAPQREMARNSEIQRLKSQGLTEDSPAFQRAMLRQGQADTDAQLKSLLAGQSEYGNQFARASGQNQQNFGQRSDAEKFAMGLRGQQFGEQGSQLELDSTKRNQDIQEMLTQRQVPLNELEQKMGMQSGGGPAFGQFAGATDQQGVDYLGAADKQYQANVGATNAKNQGKSNTMSGIASLAGTAAMVFL
jgi:hypothetical protein